jgi:hypothetical protein
VQGNIKPRTNATPSRLARCERLSGTKRAKAALLGAMFGASVDPLAVVRGANVAHADGPYEHEKKWAE